MVKSELADSRCPGAVHAVPARDGLLLRVRVPGGNLTNSQLGTLADIAERYGDAHLDLTSRANVQLRGLKRPALHRVATALEESALLPSREHDRVRNIAASPFAGADAGELFDIRPLLRELDERLIADARLAALPAKFAFALDGGARAFNSNEADLSLRAVSSDAGVRFHLIIAGTPSGFGASPRRAIDVLLEAAHCAFDLATDYAAGKTWRVATVPNMAGAIVERLSGKAQPCATPDRSPRALRPLGVTDGAEPGLANVLPSVPLGRLSSVQARTIQILAARYEMDVRLAWWRGVVLAGAIRTQLPQIERELVSAGLPPDDSNGFAGIAACSGMHGCTEAKADVRSDAARLAARVAGLRAGQGWNVHLAGCEKRCAMRAGATVDIIATASGYDVRVGGICVAQNVSSDEAIDVAASARVQT